MVFQNRLNADELDALILDFDGVLTDNHVMVDQAGNEQVRCHRGDGLAFDVLRKLNVQSYILSTETNPVVKTRARKLKVPLLQGVNNKQETLISLAQKEKIDLTRTLYVGNDLNDFYAMQTCGYSACPADSHPKITEIATFKLKTKGGQGVVREIVEDVLRIDMLKSFKSK